MDSDVLYAALDKIRGENAGSGLLPTETQALIDYLNRVNAKSEQTEGEVALIRHIRSVLHHQAVAARLEKTAGEQKDRTNHELRAALDRYLEQRFDEVQESDGALLQSTARKLADMAATTAPSPNEVRLAKLIASCLVAYEAWLSAQP